MPNKVQYEGGDDFKDADVDAPPKSKQDKKLDKYGDDMGNFSVAGNSKIKDGIVKERGCTDVICLGLFIVFLISMISFTSYCFAEGDVAKYVAPVQYPTPLICGHNNTGGDMTAKPFLHFTSFDKPFDNSKCVAKCNSTCEESMAHYCIPIASGKHECPATKHEVKLLKEGFTAMLNSNPAGKQVMDLYKSSRAIYISIASAIVFCFIYIYFMSAFAEPLAWGIIGITQVSLFIGCGACIFEYLGHKGSTDALTQKMATYMLIGGIVLGLLAIIMLIMLICGFNQLKIAIDVVDASSDFIAKTKRIVALPVIYFFVQVIVVMIWFGAMICIWSIGNIGVKTGAVGDKAGHQLKTVQFDGKTSAGDIYIIACVMFFGLLWIIAFLNAQQSFIVMASGASYYFTSSAEAEGFADVSTGIKLAWVNHAGSIAFGSFIIALVEFIRIVVMVITEQATKASGNNPAVKCIACCANCIMACIEKIVDYINKAAYAYMAVSGDGFCTAAWNGFMLNMKHALEFAWAKVLAELFIFTGKISLVAINCGFLYLTMKFITNDLTGTDAVSSIWGPMFITALITYVAASVFLGLFSNTVLALMTCLTIDIDLNGEPKYGPPTFHDSLSKIKTGKPSNAIADGGWEAPKGDGNDQEAKANNDMS